MLRLEDFRLRRLTAAETSLVRAWRNRPQIRGVMIHDRIISRREHHEWFKRIRHDPCTRFLLFEFHCRPAGVTNFTAIDRAKRSCLWGFYRGRDDMPLAGGVMLGYLSLEYAFVALRMATVSAGVLEHNYSSRTLFRRLGFQETGRAEQVLCDEAGEETTLRLIRYTLTAADWRREHKSRVTALLHGAGILMPGMPAAAAP